MKKSIVRCWRIENWRGKAQPDELYITYPEDNWGHDLISCLECGHIYSVDISRQGYFGPEIEKKLVGLHCIRCGKPLDKSVAPYPEKYLSKEGIVAFQRPRKIPADEDSITVSFDEIYS